MHNLFSKLTRLAVLNTVFYVSVKTRPLARVAAATLNFDDSWMYFMAELKKLIAKL